MCTVGKKLYSAQLIQHHFEKNHNLTAVFKNCIPSKERNTLTYTKDPSMIADEFNHYFASVGSSTALAAEKLAKDYNLQLTNPLTRTNIHPIPTSMLIPLLKEGDHETPNNNRPLSLLVTVLKNRWKNCFKTI